MCLALHPFTSIQKFVTCRCTAHIHNSNSGNVQTSRISMYENTTELKVVKRVNTSSIQSKMSHVSNRKQKTDRRSYLLYIVCNNKAKRERCVRFDRMTTTTTKWKQQQQQQKKRRRYYIRVDNMHLVYYYTITVIVTVTVSISLSDTNIQIYCMFFDPFILWATSLYIFERDTHMIIILHC